MNMIIALTTAWLSKQYLSSDDALGHVCWKSCADSCSPVCTVFREEDWGKSSERAKYTDCRQSNRKSLITNRRRRTLHL